jgi:outer membrane immunogenic protein
MMFKLSLLSGTACVLLVGAAAAADLPSRRAPPVYIAPVIPVFTWTGAYIGANVGYAFSDRDTGLTTANDPVTQAQLTFSTVPTTFRLHQSGITAGGQVGYNYQLPSGSFGGFGGGGVVIGVEADAAYTDLKRSDTVVDAFQVTSAYRSKLDYLGTVRGRLGYAFDRVLVYGTGGFAYGETSFGQSIVAGNANNLLLWSGSRSGMQTGYAVGGGIEYALPTASFLNPFNSSAVTIRAEYLHYDLGSRTVELPGAAVAGTSFTDHYRTSGNIVRGALNYKFDFAQPIPVVARY